MVDMPHHSDDDTPVDHTLLLVLHVFRLHRARAGQVLLKENFIQFEAETECGLEVLHGGIKRGLDEGLFENGPTNSIRLTDLGFAKLKNLPIEKPIAAMSASERAGRDWIEGSSQSRDPHGSG